MPATFSSPPSGSVQQATGTDHLTDQLPSTSSTHDDGNDISEPTAKRFRFLSRHIARPSTATTVDGLHKTISCSHVMSVLSIIMISYSTGIVQKEINIVNI
jgi:hypothetical protein